jgi:Ferric reductase like transmembrane component
MRTKISTLRESALGRLGGILVAALLGLLLLPPVIPYVPVWEVAAGSGYGACLAMILTFRLAPMPSTPATNRHRWKLHRATGYAMAVLVALHVAVMLAGDPFTLDYLGWMIPLHVLTGLLAALALLLAVASREPRLRAALRLTGWPRLHLSASVAACGFAYAHVATSSGKLITARGYVLLAAIFAALLGPASLSLIRGPRRWLASRRVRARTGWTVAQPRRPSPWLVLAGLGAATLLLITVPSLVRLASG